VNLAAVRAELPVLGRFAYLNTGTFGPLPRRTVETMATWQRRSVEEPRASYALFEEILGLRATLRAAIERLLGAEAGAVALTTSTTEGCNTVVAGLRLRPGDEVVTTDSEHPGLLGALRAWKLDVRAARVSEVPASGSFEAIAREVTPRTRLVAVSHVLWTNGHVLPIRKLTALGPPVLVDGAQGAGAIPVDVAALGCDFYTVSGQKWPLGPDATGALYLRPDWIERLELSAPSYLSWEDPAALVPWPDARRFEGVFLPSASAAGLLASLEFAREAGDERFSHARAMTERCRALVRERAELLTEPEQATLVTWRVDGDPMALVRRLEERGVIVRTFPGLPYARASCGFWTSEDDLERLADGL
jgi:selenocysteine lyase/cysteine desulfurase